MSLRSGHGCGLESIGPVRAGRWVARLNRNDYIGKRGENLFRVIIIEFCDGWPMFDETFLGEKHPTTDFMVELLGREGGPAPFFVQVKATRSNYRGRGSGRKLVVKLAREEVEKLARLPFPAYVVGIDVESGRGYIVDARRIAPRALSGIGVDRLMDCAALRRLWHEVDDWYRAISPRIDETGARLDEEANP